MALIRFEAPVLDRVIDGDTFVLRLDARILHPEYENWKPKIRLAGVDAAELNEAGGASAKQAVTAFFANSPLDYYLEAFGRDKYGRLVADIVRISDSKSLSKTILALPGTTPVTIRAQLQP